MKHLDVEETKMIKKERIMTFFALGGFLVLDEMDKEQKELDDEDIEGSDDG